MTIEFDDDEPEPKEPESLLEAAQSLIDTWEMEGCSHWDIESAVFVLKEWVEKDRKP